MVDLDAELMVQREGEEEPIQVYADELQEGDDIIFDNKDILLQSTSYNYGTDRRNEPCVSNNRRND